MQTLPKINISLCAAIAIVRDYARSRVMEQVKSVVFIILYLIGFQMLVRNHREIGFICTEGQTAVFVYAAMCAGAAGATTARLRRLCFNDADDGGAACERGILCVPAAMESAVVDALCQVADSCGDPVFRLQLIDAPIVFSHQRNGSLQT